MNQYTIYILIVTLTILLFIIIKDKYKALKLSGIIMLLSSILIIVLTFIINIYINSSIKFINISKITNYLFTKFVSSSLILFILGLTEILISQYIQQKTQLNILNKNK